MTAQGSGMLRRLLIVASFTGSTIAFFFFTLVNWLHFQTYLGDYTIFWRAGAGWPIYGDLHDLPFAYPPTALLLLRPFGLLPFWWALAAWTVFGITCLGLSAKRLVDTKAVLLGMLTASSLSLAFSGQISWFVSPLLIAGILGKRSWLNGLCFAIAASIKPQLALALPIALIARRSYRTIGWAILFGAGLFAVSVLAWGSESWVRWFNVLNDFKALLVERGLDKTGVGLAGLALKLGLPSGLFFLGTPLGCACVWRTFSRAAPGPEQFAALACGSVLLSPYVLGYDIAALSIMSVAFLFDKHRSPILWASSAMIISYFMAAPGIALMAGFLALRGSDLPVSADAKRLD
ncbi:MAG: glycosyltransferase family 87 protein [Rhodospirillales bacterium]